MNPIVTDAMATGAIAALCTGIVAFALSRLRPRAASVADGSAPKRLHLPSTLTQEKPVEVPKVEPRQPRKRRGLAHGGRSPVILIDPKTGKTLASYPTMSEAAKVHGLRTARISEACRDISTGSQQGRWRYAPDSPMDRYMTDGDWDGAWGRK